MLKSIQYRNDLQGLRAIAVLLVVIAHSGLGLIPGGFIGVDLFFVLSGYLITRNLVEEFHQNKEIDLFRFYINRLKRLFPALFVMIVIVWILGAILLSKLELFNITQSTKYAIFWVSNLYFNYSSIDYFDEHSGIDLFLHTWSLSVEEQFYVIWPMILLVSLKKISKDLWNNEAFFFTLIVAFLFSFSICIVLNNSTSFGAFYLMPARIWQFSLGAIVYTLFESNYRLQMEFSRLFRYIFLFIGIVLILVSSIFIDTNYISYPGLWALFPSIGASLVILAGINARLNRNILNNSILVWLGNRSYSIYLWHWPIFIFSHIYGFKGDIRFTILMFLLVLLVSIFSYNFIEIPFWKGRLKNLLPKRVLLIYLLPTLLLAIFLQFLVSPLVQKDEQTDLSREWRFDLPVIYKMGCDDWYDNSNYRPCYFNADKYKKTVVLLGDSIGIQWFSSFHDIFYKEGWRIIVLTKSSCPIADVNYFYPRLNRYFTECNDWKESILRELSNIKPDVVIFGSAHTYDFTREQWERGTSSFSKSLSEVSEYVYLIPGTPKLNFDGPSCVARNISRDGIVKRKNCFDVNALNSAREISEILRNTIVSYSSVSLLDLNDLVCPNDVCNALTEDGFVVFRDSQHLTNTFVLKNIDEIRKRLIDKNNYIFN